MKVKELLEALKDVDLETFVVVNGYEGGYSTPTSVEIINISGPHDVEWYYGEYEVCTKDDQDVVKAILLPR
jgi:hypothetical protein